MSMRSISFSSSFSILWSNCRSLKLFSRIGSTNSRIIWRTFVSNPMRSRSLYMAAYAAVFMIWGSTSRIDLSRSRFSLLGFLSFNGNLLGDPFSSTSIDLRFPSGFLEGESSPPTSSAFFLLLSRPIFDGDDTSLPSFCLDLSYLLAGCDMFLYFI